MIASFSISRSGVLTTTRLAKNVLPPETLVRWIDWLDQQEGVRSLPYRAGLAAGQSKVLENLKTKGIELEPMNLSKYSKAVGISGDSYASLVI